MGKFDKQFEQEMKQQRPVSEKTRAALDSIYLELSPSTAQSANRFKWFSKSRKLVLAATVVLIAGSLALVSYTPLNDAVSKLLGFDWFSSKTLSDANFISKQTAIFTDQETTIKLEEVFSDQTQVGLHFTIKLPEKSPLMAKNMSEYILNFALYNGDGTLLADANSGLNNDDQDSLMTGTYKFISQKAANANTINLTVLLHGDLKADVPELKNASVKITGISAKDERANQEGFNKAEDNSIKGHWNLPIDSQMVKALPVIDFENAAAASDISVISAKAYPSSFVLTMKYTDTLQEMLKRNDSGVFTLSGSNNDGSFTYNLMQIDTQQQAGETVKILVFEYGGYDAFNSVSVQLSDVDTLILREK